MSAIKLSNIGPVHKLTIPIPEEGGVVVLAGGHGLGKSTSLRAVDALASGRKKETGSLSVRDGAASGLVDGLNVKITVGKRANRVGELSVNSIEGKLSIAELVDPQIMDADRADAKRTKAVLQVCNVTADESLFYGLVGGPEEFRKLVPPAATKTDDVLVMAEAVKACFEEGARQAEGAANNERARADACSEVARDADLNSESNGDVLQAALEKAIRNEQEVRSRAENAAKHNARVADVKTRMAGIDISIVTQAVHDARVKEQATADVLQLIDAEIEDLEKKIVLAQRRRREALAEHAHAVEQLDAAERHEKTVETWKNALAEVGEPLPEVPQAEIDAAAEAVMSARKANENGAVIRAAKAKLQKRDEHLATAIEHDKRGLRLRDAAANVDTVLSDQIAKLGCALRVDKGRLVTKTDRGDAELYAELSEGERWRLALDLAIDAVGPSGLLTAPQTAWDGLNTDMRNLIAEHCRSRKAVLITAEVTNDEELTAQVYEPAKIN